MLLVDNGKREEACALALLRLFMKWLNSDIICFQIPE